MEQFLTKPWQKFLDKFKDIESEPFKSKVFLWRQEHMLAYMCKRFEMLYGHKFSIAMDKSPTKCTEMVFVRKMISSLGTTDMVKVKNYVDWVYDTKVIPNNKKLTKFSYFMSQGFCNEFNFKQVEQKIIKRSTELPPTYKAIAANLNVSVNTYGDLAFIKMAADKAKGDLANINVQFLENIKTLGFEVQMLETIAE